MENFEFQNSTKIIFGREKENDVGKNVKKFADRVLLHYGGGSIKKTGLYDRIMKSLKDEGIEVVEFPGAKPNPVLSHVEKGIKLCRDKKIEFILAVGGGSVIDSAKAIALGVPYEGKLWDLYDKKAKPEKALLTGVVLTIAAAGSETSRYAVITNEDGWQKKAIHSDMIRPEFAILNPELTFSLPAYQTACGAVDIMAHVMERYFTNSKDVDLTDRLCESTLKVMIKHTPIALKEPCNYSARAEIMLAGTLAHNDFLDVGRIKDFGSHRVEHQLSAIYDIAHGAGLAIIMPAWMRYVYKYRIDKFVQFATRVWNIDEDMENPERVALEGIKKLESFFKSIGMPATLKDINIGNDRFEEMAGMATTGGPAGNFIKLDKDAIIKIYEIAAG